MKIHVLPSGPIQTVGYLLTESKLGEAILIDAPGGILAQVTPLLAAERCQLTELWLTHGHWDHTQDAARVKRATAALVRAHSSDEGLIENPALMSAFIIPGLTLEPVTIDHFVTGGQKLAALGREFEVRHVPGHCPGNVLFYSATDQAAFVGDALFQRGVGRWDLPGGNFDELARSIREQIYSLPDGTRIFPGHGPATSVGEEREENPFVAAVAP